MLAALCLVIGRRGRRIEDCGLQYLIGYNRTGGCNRGFIVLCNVVWVGCYKRPFVVFRTIQLEKNNEELLNRLSESCEELLEQTMKTQNCH